LHTQLKQQIGGQWASSPGLVQGAEGKGVAELFKNPADVFAKGLTVGGVKYMGIKGDSRYVFDVISLCLQGNDLLHADQSMARKGQQVLLRPNLTTPLLLVTTTRNNNQVMPPLLLKS
jgi:Profilin